jgi:hypothetical protein
VDRRAADKRADAKVIIVSSCDFPGRVNVRAILSAPHPRESVCEISRISLIDAEKGNGRLKRVLILLKSTAFDGNAHPIRTVNIIGRVSRPIIPAGI